MCFSVSASVFTLTNPWTSSICLCKSSIILSMSLFSCGFNNTIIIIIKKSASPLIYLHVKCWPCPETLNICWQWLASVVRCRVYWSQQFCKVYNYKGLLPLHGLTAEVATDQSSFCQILACFRIFTFLHFTVDSHQTTVLGSACSMAENFTWRSHKQSWLCLLNSFATEILPSIFPFCTELVFWCKKNHGYGYKNGYISVSNKARHKSCVSL